MQSALHFTIWNLFSILVIVQKPASDEISVLFLPVSLLPQLWLSLLLASMSHCYLWSVMNEQPNLQFEKETDRQIYRYHCSQCSLAFRTEQRLASHALHHTFRSSSRCTKCDQSFRSHELLKRHNAQEHTNGQFFFCNLFAIRSLLIWIFLQTTILKCKSFPWHF